MTESLTMRPAPPTAARGHMPFKGHRTCAKWGPGVMEQRFAEGLAKHGDVIRAARLVGQNKAWGERTLRSICRDLGVRP